MNTENPPIPILFLVYKSFLAVKMFDLTLIKFHSWKSGWLANERIEWNFHIIIIRWMTLFDFY
jgi:hypothetical protein